MGFAEYETSRSKGQPISLLLFRYGDGENDFFAYTDGEQQVVFADVTYEPTTIEMDEVSSSGSLDKATLSVSVPQDTELVDMFRERPPSSVVTLIIRQGHANDPDEQFIVGWSGKVIAFEVDGDTDIATFGCEPISTSMTRTMLRRHWQYGCPHALYGPQCRASKAAATVTRTAVDVSGAIVFLSSEWETAPRKAKYVGGIAEWTDSSGRREVRRILKCFDDGSVQLNNTADGLAAGGALKLSLGCNHKSGIPALNDDGDCGPLHGNILNYGGDLWIPLENPVGIKNNYY